MDFIKKLFGHEKNTLQDKLRYSDTSGSSKTVLPIENPIAIIESHIKNLININLSPLHVYKEDIYIQQNDISNYLRKIVYHFDIVFGYHLLENNKDIKYWNIFSKNLNKIQSVQFIDSNYDNSLSDDEKGPAWILISIMENSFKSSIYEIYTQKLDMKFYQPDSFLGKEKYEILNAAENLSRLSSLFSNLNFDIVEEYLNYMENGRKFTKEAINYPIKKYKIEDYFSGNKKITTVEFLKSELLQGISPIKLQRMKSRDNILKDDNLNLNSQNFKTSSSYFKSPNNGPNTSLVNKESFNYANFTETGSNNGKFTKNNNNTLDSLINLIDKDNTTFIEKNPKYITDYHTNFKRLSSGDEKYANKITNENLNIKNKKIKKLNELSDHPFNNNSLSLKNYPMFLKKMHLKGKTLYDEQKARKHYLEERFKVTKILNFAECYHNNYFSFMENSPINSSYRRKKSSIDVDIRTIAKNNIISCKENYPFERFIKVFKKYDKNKFTRKDIIYVKGRFVEITNSMLFYLNNYYRKFEYFKFNLNVNKDEKPITLADQNYQCQLCLKVFKRYWFIIFTKVYWCSYYNRFICEDCHSPEFSILPSFVIKLWNFQKFSISKKAKLILDKWNNQPVLYIKGSDDLLKVSSKFRAAATLRRKIHKIFDLMKCENYELKANQILGEYIYFVIKETIFSLKDLYNIYDGTLIKKLQKYCNLFEKHILSCPICNYKGNKCMICLSDELLFSYNIENVYYCQECKKIFHRKCSQFHPCYINRIEL